MTEVEERLFERLAPPSRSRDVRAIFILGAPRTGSTLLYQLLAKHGKLPFIANLTNESFGKTPVVGLAIQRAVACDETIALDSRFGKTTGSFQPSEASAVMTHWFGGGHPSQTVSALIRPNMEPHFHSTLVAAERLFDRPLLIKNAWNCFRLAYLIRTLPRAEFVWIRRDIKASAKSDLHARYVVQGAADRWNSATPATLEELKRRPFIEQVVENQYEFNRAILSELNVHAQGRHCVVWYEDLCTSPGATLVRVLRTVLGTEYPDVFDIPPLSIAKGWNLAPEDCLGIDRFVEQNMRRFAGSCYESDTRKPRPAGELC